MCSELHGASEHYLIWVAVLGSFRRLWISGTSNCRSRPRNTQAPAFLQKERNEESTTRPNCIFAPRAGSTIGTGNASGFFAIRPRRMESGIEPFIFTTRAFNSDGSYRRRNPD